MSNPFQPVVASPLPDKTGYTWTYASRLGDMLALAEELYGERDHTYTILGVEFISGIPQTWYPGHRKNIVIQLTLECLSDTMRGCYQLAHECIHLLSPTGESQANVLEEGLATYFSVLYMREKMKSPGWHSTLPSYTRAEGLLHQLLAIDSEAIKTLRNAQPTLSKISAALILKHYPILPEPVAIQLAERFNRNWVPSI